MPLARVQAVSTGLPGSPYLSTFYFDPTLGTPDNWTAAVNAYWTSMRSQLSNALSVRINSEIALMSEVTGQIGGFVNGTASTVTGTATGDLLPSASQGLIRLRSGAYVNGREVRGRTFVPGWTESSSSAGRPTTDAVGYMNTAGSVLRSAPNALLMVWSRKNGVASPVTLASAWGEWAVLRSRRD